MSSLAYAKLSATPSATSWSQIYNAGNLFICLSLTAHGDKEHSLHTLGKELFNNLEAEFFTLEEKTTTTIKEAITKSTASLDETVTANLCLAYFANDVLSLFLQGNGRVVMKREDKLGVLLEQMAAAKGIVKTATGRLQDGDTIILETQQFASSVSDEKITKALELALPNDIADALSLPMHEREDGGQAAIIIMYHGAVLPVEADEEAVDETEEPAIVAAPVAPSPVKTKQPLRFPRLPHLSHTKKLFLSIIAIIVALLIISIVFTRNKQQQAHLTTLFEAVYQPAKKSYDEGKALESLNKTLSQQDFLKAEKLLKDSQSAFPKGSKEAEQIADLLKKVEAELEAPAAKESLNKSELKLTVLNGSGTPGAASEIATFLKDRGYTIATTGNAATYDFKGLTILTKKDKNAYLDLLKKDLSGKSTTIVTKTDDTIATDAEVIVGK